MAVAASTALHSGGTHIAPWRCRFPHPCCTHGTSFSKRPTHVLRQDGRIFITSKGRERFKITGIVKEKPVLIAEVEELEEDEVDDTEQVGASAVRLMHVRARARACMDAGRRGPHTQRSLVCEARGEVQPQARSKLVLGSVQLVATPRLRRPV